MQLECFLFQCSGEIFDFLLEVSFLMSQAFYRRLWNVQTARWASRLACWEIEFLLLIPTGDLNVKSPWMWSDFSWNPFCFDVRQARGRGGGRRGGGSDIAQILHIISQEKNKNNRTVSQKDKKNNCGYLFFWAFLSIKDTFHLVSKRENYSICCYGRCLRSGLECVCVSSHV